MRRPTLAQVAPSCQLEVRVLCDGISQYLSIYDLRRLWHGQRPLRLDSVGLARGFFMAGLFLCFLCAFCSDALKVSVLS